MGVKVRVLTSIARFPNQLRAGAELEVDEELAQDWFDRKLAEPCAKASKPKAKAKAAPKAPPAMADTLPPEAPPAPEPAKAPKRKSAKATK